MSAKCLRCGAGNEWIQGKALSPSWHCPPDEDAQAAELLTLRQERDALREQLETAKEVAAEWHQTAISRANERDALLERNARLVALLERMPSFVERRCWPDCLCGKCQFFIAIDAELKAKDGA